MWILFDRVSIRYNEDNDFYMCLFNFFRIHGFVKPEDKRTDLIDVIGKAKNDKDRYFGSVLQSESRDSPLNRRWRPCVQSHEYRLTGTVSGEGLRCSDRMLLSHIVSPVLSFVLSSSQSSPILMPLLWGTFDPLPLGMWLPSFTQRVFFVPVFLYSGRFRSRRDGI